jgi:hypothetical protein
MPSSVPATAKRAYSRKLEYFLNGLLKCSYFPSFLSGNSLLREWCKYRYGVFPESGYPGGGDRIYPHVYNEGNVTKINAGCEEDGGLFCPMDGSYNRRAPTKQNLMCLESSAIETIMDSKDLKMAPNATEYVPPTFEYVVPKSSKYTIVLERTSTMNANGRWTNVKRAFYRFLNYLPVGSEISIVTFGKEAALNLPPTIVTDANREGLHGRIPRKVLSDDLACVFCALNMSLGEIGGTVVLVTGSPRKPQMMERLLETIGNTSAKVFPVAYPGTAHPDVVSLARNGGKHYAVNEGGAVAPLTYLTEILLDVLRSSEPGLEIQKVHETKHLSYEFAGTFTLEDSMLDGMSVTLNVDDEEKVEFFEITNPSGKKHLFSKFEDGMVVFQHPGRAEPGIWTYHSKLYPTAGLPAERMTVDVVSRKSSNAPGGESPFLLDVFTSVDGKQLDVYNEPVVIYARLTQGGSLPVLGARVVAKVARPGNDSDEEEKVVELVLRDDGAGDPDVTGDDGIYSAHFSDFASVPGFYSVQVVAGHNDGLARTVRRLDVDGGVVYSGNEGEEKLGTPDHCRSPSAHFCLLYTSRSKKKLPLDAAVSVVYCFRLNLASPADCVYIKLAALPLDHRVIQFRTFFFIFAESCCGSRVRFRETIPSSPFHRQSVGPGFYAKQGISPRTDIAPPNRIMDFRLARTIESSLYVQLEWSAPGGDYENGKGKNREKLSCKTIKDDIGS